jgi:hypothetical protein
MADKEIFRQQIRDLQEVYNCTIADREVSVMWERLKHLSNDQLVTAVDIAIAEFDKRPRANRLLELVEGKQSALLNQEAQAEWGNVMEQLNQPFDAPIQLSQKTRLALKRIGGISAVQNAPISQIQWKRKEFIEQYQEIGEVQKAVVAQKELPQSLAQSIDKTLENASKSLSSVSDSLNSIPESFY